MKFQRKTGYYPQPTHEFNLPAGWSCPMAVDCLTKADRDTGKLVKTGPGYRCYAAVAERFPSVRDTRWANFEEVKRILKDPDALFDIPARATHVRIHGSGTSSPRSTSTAGAPRRPRTRTSSSGPSRNP